MNSQIICALDIANAALERIGMRKINGFYDHPMVMAIYHPTRRELLCAKKWDNMLKHATMKKNIRGEYPLPNFSFLESPILRVWSINGMTYGDYAIDCKKRIVTFNKEVPDKLDVEYIPDIEIPSDFCAIFLNAFILKLAMKLSSLISNEKKREKIYFELEKEFNQLMNS